jgi:electron transport complex protein RnfE
MNRYCLLVAGLAPLLGATGTFIQAAALGTGMLLVSILHQALLAPLRTRLSGAMYWVASLLLIAALVSCLQLALRAWALPLALALGHFPALLCLQCLVADGLLPAAGRWRQLLTQLAVLLMLYLLLGASRQWLEQGLGLHGASLGFGALLLLGSLLALYNRLRLGHAPSRRQGTR